ncbi:XRE family transcriptional regulator [Streptomyces sp. SCL15-6]|uniref:RICIN domain-containing protein n=1 Tax=Streptomyces sp. SCL15-6 TaxID=2967222 RepID=UPI0029661103|nr:XRE family transcriptional regulator [Streptomyces sp. SCL15-6]
MGNQGELSPYEAKDAAEFVASMRRLKALSGRTFRELEEQAARNGDVLARSTLADILRRTNLPRPDLLAAFVRACGDGRRVGAWLDARDRIAADVATGPATTPDPGPGPGPDAGNGNGNGNGTDEAPPQAAEPTAPRPRRSRGRTVALVAALTLPLLAVAAWGLFPHGSDGSGTASGAATDGWVTLRPARTPDLCLTDGRDRKGAYASALAVQLPCARSTVPRTYLEPVGEGLYHIQWHHPEEGKGCLTVMGSGPVKGMLEPRNDCTHATLFRLEAGPDDDAEGVRIRPVTGSRCIGIADDLTTEGAEAIEERCTGEADQRFLVRAD